MASTLPKPKSDIGIRLVSASIMLAVAFGAFWLGSIWFTGFVVLVGIGTFWEWWGLVRRITSKPWARIAWLAGGIVYIATACQMFIGSNAMGIFDLLPAYIAVLLVIATDVGAYCVGRTVGGAKLWPSVSPNKTWAGLIGGMTASALALVVLSAPDSTSRAVFLTLFGALVALVAQGGDLFESWMKRRAGVKDSGRLLPGHGGLFDRIDGLLAVEFTSALVMIVVAASVVR